MRKTLIVLAVIAASLAAAAEPLPAKLICKDGKPVAVQIIVAEPDLYTIVIPPGACAVQKTPPAEKPRSSASQPVRSKTT